MAVRQYQLTEEKLRSIIQECQPIGDVDAVLARLGDQFNAMMLEVGVEGHAFHPHQYDSNCDSAGCIVMPFGWKDPYAKK